MEIKKGDTFISKRLLDLEWKPAPGQRYADGPKALMKVTSVKGRIIYYTYASDETNKASWFATKEQFEKGEV